MAAAALVCASAASASVGLRLAAVAEGPLHALAREGAEVTVQLDVTRPPDVRPPEVHGSQVRRYTLVRGRARRLDAGGVAGGGPVSVRSPLLVVAAGEGWEHLLPSQRIRVSGELALPRHDELLSAVLFVRGPPEVLTGPSAVQRAAGRIRAGLRAAVRPLPAAEEGLLPGLVVGDTSLMPRRLVHDFRETGLGHLTAVSGTNVSLILAAVLGLARLLGLGSRMAPLAGGVAVIGFAVVANPSPSVLRATVMGLIAVVALVTGRTRHGISALCAATLGLVLFDPGLARSYGFALSVLATAGLLVLAPGWRDRMARRVPRGLAEALAVPAAAEVVCLPVAVMLSGRVSLVAIPANLLVAPAVGPATIFGVLAAVAAPLWLPLAKVIAWPGGVAAGWIVTVARAGAKLPYSTLPWPAGVAGGIAAALCVLAVAAARPRWRQFAVSCLAAVLLAALTVRTLPSSWPPRNWLMVMCDVGQGDALALAAGRHRAVLVDTGPDPRLVDRCLRDLHVRRIPLLVLTHPHADHVSGLPGALRGRSVARVLVGRLPSDQVDAAPVRAWLRRARVPVRRAVAGRTWEIGPLRLRALGPPGRVFPAGKRFRATSEDGGGENSEENNGSVVLRATWPGVSALLTGDIEPEAQRALLDFSDRADVLKVPHHGSSAQAWPFLAAVDPRVALISVGEDNDYGHPADATLAMLRRVGARIYRTDRDGAVAVVRRDGHLAVVPRGVVRRRGVRARGADKQSLARGSKPLPRCRSPPELVAGMLRVWLRTTLSLLSPSSSARRSFSPTVRCPGSPRRRANASPRSRCGS